MPNGGSDCCGTCCFSEARSEDKGIALKPGRDSCCTIRDLPIENPFWTYCANHPHHNPDRIHVPIGPVYICDSYPYARRVWVQSPDTEAIRESLLVLLGRVEETPALEYPTSTRFDHEIIKQVLEFRDQRAVTDLRRIARFNPAAKSPGHFGHDRVVTVALAIEALATIVGDDALEELQRGLRYGLSGVRLPPAEGREEPASPEATKEADPSEDRLAAIRYHTVLGLRHCNSPEARALLREAETDPHPEVVAFAREILASTGPAS